MLLKCSKRKFEDRDSAEKKLRHIKTITTLPQKIPIRSYFCVECNAYHLTSITESENARFKNKQKEKQAIRIAKVADHWTAKLESKCKRKKR